MTPVVGVTAWSTVVRDVPVNLPHQVVAENYLQALQSAGLNPKAEAERARREAEVNGLSRTTTR